MKWIKATRALPKESGEYLVGLATRDGDKFYNITNVSYSAVHMRFNTHDFNTAEKAKRVAFPNRGLYWMPMPEPPKEMTR